MYEKALEIAEPTSRVNILKASGRNVRSEFKKKQYFCFVLFRFVRFTNIYTLHPLFFIHQHVRYQRLVGKPSATDHATFVVISLNAVHAFNCAQVKCSM